jgi:putative transposase
MIIQSAEHTGFAACKGTLAVTVSHWPVLGRIEPLCDIDHISRTPSELTIKCWLIVEAHGFQPCENRPKVKAAFSRCGMDNLADRTFFVTSVTWQRRPLFRSERAATIFIETLFGYRERAIFQLYEFVLMPDHIHLLLAPKPTIALERAMQFIKGGYSHRFMKETGSRMEIWERSFTNHRVRDAADYEQHRSYIHLNPVRARLAQRSQDYRYSSAHNGFSLDEAPQRLKPVA